MAPGTFSVSANGPGLGDTKTFFRGFKDGQYSMTYDGIPFNDTNDPTHHSWAFFPAQTIGSTVFDRSPGSAADHRPVDLRRVGQPAVAIAECRSAAQRHGVVRLVQHAAVRRRLQHRPVRRRRQVAPDVRRCTRCASDGYQTFNFQKRDAFSAKYQYQVSDNTSLTAFTSIMHLKSNTPNQKGSTRAQIAAVRRQLPDDRRPGVAAVLQVQLLLDPDRLRVRRRPDAPRQRLVDRQQDLHDALLQQAELQRRDDDHGDERDRQAEQLPEGTATSCRSPTCRTRGIFRTGLWSEYASTDRYQIPSDPRTWVDAALPNFHEMFGTTTLQPYAEYSWRALPNLTITPGIKYAYYRQNLTQFADNGKTVGNLNGAPSSSTPPSTTRGCRRSTRTCCVQPYWSMYGQYGKGQNIPPSSVFDVKNAQVGTLPEADSHRHRTSSARSGSRAARRSTSTSTTSTSRAITRRRSTRSPATRCTS